MQNANCISDPTWNLQRVSDSLTRIAPSFYRLIPKLIAVEVNAQKTVCERVHGTTHLKKKVYNNLSSKLKKIIAQRDPQKITETLEKCAHLVKFSHHNIRASEPDETEL